MEQEQHQQQQGGGGPYQQGQQGGGQQQAGSSSLGVQQQQQAAYHAVVQQQQQQLHMFWAFQMQEIEQVSDFKNHQLPLARIKKIMKADEDVRMISAEAPVLFAKACEMFILELTLRSWIHAEENKRRTLQKNDIAAAITRTDIFDFLVDIVPRDDSKDDALPLGPAAPPYYFPAQPIIGMMPRPPMQPMDPSLYMQRPYAQQQQVWHHPDTHAYAHPPQMPDGQPFLQHQMQDASSYANPTSSNE